MFLYSVCVNTPVLRRIPFANTITVQHNFYAVLLFFNSVLEPIYSWFIHLLIFVPYFAAILGYAPIINENKPLTDREIVINHNKSIVISIAWLIISTLLLFYKPILSSAIDLTLLVIAALMMIEILKRRREKT